MKRLLLAMLLVAIGLGGHAWFEGHRPAAARSSAVDTVATPGPAVAPSVRMPRRPFV